VEYLPDPDEEYAINAWSIMAKQKTDIARTVEMYVQKMNLAQDTTAVAAQLATSAGAVSKSAVDALVAQRQTESTAATAAAKARNDAVRAKQGDVATKKADLLKASVDLAAAQTALNDAVTAGTTDPTTLKSLKDAVASKTIAVRKAEIDVQTAEAAVVTAKNFDQPLLNNNADAPGNMPSAPGPVIYRIVENPRTGGIALERVHFKLFSFSGRTTRVTEGPQLDFQTWGKKPAGDNGGKPDSGKTKIPQIIGPTTLPVNKFLNVYSQAVSFDAEIKKPLTSETEVSGQGGDQRKWLTKIAISGTNSVTLTWDKDTPNGNYAVNLVMLFKNDTCYFFPLQIEVK
jgi:hypothetical protein